MQGFRGAARRPQSGAPIVHVVVGVSMALSSLEVWSEPGLGPGLIKGEEMSERKVYKDYEESDVRAAFEHAHPSSWGDLISYLEQHGLTTHHITPGEAAHMIADAKQALKDNVPFPQNPVQAYRVMKSHRNPELVRQEEQTWIAKSEQYEKERERRA